MGYLEKKKRNARKPKMRIGIGGRERYAIKYFKLGDKLKEKCNKYKNSINSCNIHFKKIQQYINNVVSNLTASVLLDKLGSPELADGCRDQYGESLQQAILEADKWFEDFEILEKNYKEIKKIGKKY